MYSMNRTSRGRPSVKATKSSSSSSFRPRITTQFTWPRQLGSESCLQRALMRTTFGVWHCSAPACASGHPLFHGWGIPWWPLLFSIPNEGGELGLDVTWPAAVGGSRPLSRLSMVKGQCHGPMVTLPGRLRKGGSSQQGWQILTFTGL